MHNNYSPELQKLLVCVEVALIQAGQNAQRLAEQTGTKLITKERETWSAISQGVNEGTVDRTLSAQPQR